MKARHDISNSSGKQRWWAGNSFSQAPAMMASISSQVFLQRNNMEIHPPASHSISSSSDSDDIKSRQAPYSACFGERCYLMHYVKI